METASPSAPLPHCARHARHLAHCPVCVKARAHAEPYVERRQPPLPRSFGLKDDITPATFRPPGRFSTALDDEPPEVSLSLLALRFLLRLIWPFGRVF